jgi:tRNA(Leu) C34 or U34 (ribose-2'-O)-methylase TrmL
LAGANLPHWRLGLKSMRGFAVIALHNPKTPANIGGALRACGCYGAKLVVIGGPRPLRLAKLATDTQKAWRHIPHVLVDDIFDACPYDAVPVAIDLIEGARSLLTYNHPERAFYIFGAEDATLGKKVLDKCRDKVVVPTAYCMNLAATVNVILYDRLSKEMAQ